MKIVLHIGMERTASTSMQKNLIHNRRPLNDNGIYYLHTDKINCIDLAIAFGTNNRFDFFEVFGISEVKKIEIKKSTIKLNFQSKLNSIKHSGKYHTCIISSEHFYSRLNDTSDIKNLYDFLKIHCDEFQLFMFKRNKKDFIQSLYTIAMSAGHNLSFDNFSYIVSNDRRYFPLKHIISNWESVFREEISILDFNSLATSKNPTNTMLQHMGYDLKLNEKFYVNMQKTDLALITLQRINQFFPRYLNWTSPNPRPWLGNILRSIVLKFLL